MWWSVLVIRGTEEDFVLPPLRSDLYVVSLSLCLLRSPNEDRAGLRCYHVRLAIRSVLCHASWSPRTLYPKQKGCFLFLQDKNSHFLRLASYSLHSQGWPWTLNPLPSPPSPVLGFVGIGQFTWAFPFFHLSVLCFPPFSFLTSSSFPFIFCIARDQIQGHVHNG